MSASLGGESPTPSFCGPPCLPDSVPPLPLGSYHYRDPILHIRTPLQCRNRRMSALLRWCQAAAFLPRVPPALTAPLARLPNHDCPLACARRTNHISRWESVGTAVTNHISRWESVGTAVGLSHGGRHAGRCHGLLVCQLPKQVLLLSRATAQVLHSSVVSLWSHCSVMLTA
jgi:hypothetical protein